MRTLATILTLVIALVASAADQAAAAGRYIVVLQKVGEAKPVGDEVTSLGGTVEVALRDRLVVSGPASAIERLRGLAGVRYAQLVSQVQRAEQQIALPEPR